VELELKEENEESKKEEETTEKSEMNQTGMTD
jgi:hypothetical protein